MITRENADEDELMAFFVITSCGLIGNYLILRRMALVGDAISHSVLVFRGLP